MVTDQFALVKCLSSPGDGSSCRSNSIKGPELVKGDRVVDKHHDGREADGKEPIDQESQDYQQTPKDPGANIQQSEVSKPLNGEKLEFETYCLEERR